MKQIMLKDVYPIKIHLHLTQKFSAVVNKIFKLFCFLAPIINLVIVYAGYLYYAYFCNNVDVCNTQKVVLCS